VPTFDRRKERIMADENPGNVNCHFDDRRACPDRPSRARPVLKLVWSRDRLAADQSPDLPERFDFDLYPK
jgi:hypothetical protein